MSATQNFRRQHQDLLQLALEIEALLTPDGVRADAAGVRKRLARFAGKLHVHASMEDEALYPRLLAHPDAALRSLARAFRDELGDLYGAFFTYIQRWPSSEAVEANAAEFIRETREVFRLLERRMVRENDELYAAADLAE